ncbi:TetR/AcrR family transcriptional regulator [Streptomyces sp. NL15-2K]|uniref:TetR/AcrR family transcriptional regulator n=1 Tax=Streptomyces sp. NL15-2K TaxID=376149 RepID=UPI000F5675C7|nr:MULTISPECIES: TetR/AcrR family transcriptional regulator [Actinomycetes]WKX15452.1 TetR/AcrR family transcriptional regulator [Kutzneria buriramensis]GCB52637.1 tetR family transcriptional regulator [Streptomyces sp. NL15-2K]
MATTGRGPYAKTAEVRRKILQACVDAFGGAGFHGSNTKDIAQRAGISHTGLRHHFPTKEDLLIALLELRAEHSSQLLTELNARTPETDPLDALRGQLAVLRENQQSPGMIGLHSVLSGEATSPDHPAHGYYVKRYQDIRRYYTQAFTALAERGDLNATFPPAQLATITISLINGLQAQWLYDRESVDIEGTVRDFLASVVPALGR